MATRTIGAALPIRQEAEHLAKANREAEPDIIEVYWFPADDEIRLVEVLRTTLPSPSGELEPFYFAPSPADGIHLRSAVALITPAEAGRLKLPPGWGTWRSAKRV